MYSKRKHKYNFTVVRTLPRQHTERFYDEPCPCLFVRAYPSDIVVNIKYRPKTKTLRYTYCSCEYSLMELVACMQSYDLRESTYNAVLGPHYDDSKDAENREEGIVEYNDWSSKATVTCKAEHEILHYYALSEVEMITFSVAYEQDCLTKMLQNRNAYFDFVKFPYPLKRVLIRVILLCQKIWLQRFVKRAIINYRRRKVVQICLLGLPYTLIRDQILPFLYAKLFNCCDYILM